MDIITDYYVLPDEIYGVILDDIQKMYGIRILIQLGTVSKLFSKIINVIVSTIKILDKDIMKFLKDDQLRMFKSLKILDLSNNTVITNKGLEGLRLRDLNLYNNNLITDDAIRNMPINNYRASN